MAGPAHTLPRLLSASTRAPLRSAETATAADDRFDISEIAEAHYRIGDDTQGRDGRLRVRGE
jgi:hypothetical protein